MYAEVDRGSLIHSYCNTDPVTTVLPTDHSNRLTPQFPEALTHDYNSYLTIDINDESSDTDRAVSWFDEVACKPPHQDLCGAVTDYCVGDMINIHLELEYTRYLNTFISHVFSLISYKESQ